MAWLERHLEEYPGTVVAITHDRYFLDRVATRMLEINHGQLKTYEGNYSDFLEAKQKQQEIQDRTDANLLKAVERELAPGQVASVNTGMGPYTASSGCPVEVVAAVHREHDGSVVSPARTPKLTANHVTYLR